MHRAPAPAVTAVNVLHLLSIEEVLQKISIVPEGCLVKQPEILSFLMEDLSFDLLISSLEYSGVFFWWWVIKIVKCKEINTIWSTCQGNLQYQLEIPYFSVL